VRFSPWSWPCLVLMLLLSRCAWMDSMAIDDMNPNSKSATQTEQPPKSDEPTAPKKRVLVVKTVNLSRYGGDELTSLATTMIKNAIAKVDDFTVIPQEEVEGSEEFVNAFNEIQLSRIYERSRQQGIAGVFTGTIQDLIIKETGDDVGLFRTRTYTVTATVKLSLYDVATQREISTRIGSGEVVEEHTDFFKTDRGKLAVTKGYDKILTNVQSFSRKVAWTGRIAKTDINRYYINAGEMSGLLRGTLLKVYGEGQPVVDPDTKTLLGLAPGRFKGLLKIVDYFGQDGSVAIVHSGGGFREKDRVEIFTSVQQ
jgi:hypothetical protein